MSPRRRGQIRIKTLKKFIHLFNEAMLQYRVLTAREVSYEIGCSRGHAYNYARALRVVLESIIA